MKVDYHYTHSKQPIDTFPCHNGNRITKAYYNMLVGYINRGEIFASVVKVVNKTFGVESYYLISKY